MTQDAGRRRTVAVGLVDGSTKTGTLGSWDPEGEELTLETATRGPGGRLDKVGLTIPIASTSYVAFYRDADTPPSPTDQSLIEARVYTPAGNSFNVMAVTAEVDSDLGFFGWPLSRASLYGRVWFFRQRITAIEDATPLGELLIQQGLVEITELEESASAQAADRETPIGQILIENKVVPEEHVEAFAAKQTRSASGKRLRLGEILVEAGLATNDQIQEALGEQKKRRGKRLGEVLVEAGIVTEEVIARTLALKFRLPYVDLDAETVQPGAAEEIPAGIIKRFRVFPFSSTEREIRIAMADPTAVEALDMLRFSLSKRLQEVVVRPSQLAEYLRPWFPEENPEENELEELLEQLINAPDTPVVEDDELEEDPSFKEEGAVTRLAYKILLSAYQRGASDVHVEPNGPEKPTRIRQRVDGVCEVQRLLPASMRNSVVARIKIMAGLDITERRLPQDGKIRLPLKDKKIELRVATIPTANNNEDVVLRILAAGGAMPLDKAGLSERNLRETKRLAKMPYGLILVVGPTGSGKTTTLHSVLGSINTDQRKIWTAEDPVEITQAGLRQVQMKPRIGLNFATAMRAFLRADPDVIMVGEMRDLETAETGVEASLTGHLVFSTLHTNSAPETVTRMVDMGLDAFVFSDALLCVLAQRLGRRLCSDCKTPYEASRAEIDEIHKLYGAQAEGDGISKDHLTLWAATGCEKCGNSGYRGRVGIHELLVNDDAVRGTIQAEAGVDAIREAAIEGGMRTLLQDGIWKTLQGITDLRQVLAVCSK